MTDTTSSKSRKVKEEIIKEVDKIPTTSDRNMMAALSYIWIISIIMLVARKNDEFVHFHAKQGLVLFVLSIFYFIPVLGWILSILAFVGMIIGFMKAWQGQRYEIPFVYKLSQKIKL